MRRRALLGNTGLWTASLLAAGCLLPSLATAQDYGRPARTASTSVLRPASTVGWRNYTTVPDGPCGPPMSVQTDCYVGCRPCGPLRPFCFLHRVGRMLDCLIPCNLCCRSGYGGGGGCGGGPLHGCILGGRNYGCNVCCGQPACGGSCGSMHPCGSAFGSCFTPSCTSSCTSGGHCHGCSSALPGLSDPFIDDPLPPKPTAGPATEVRRPAPRPARPVSAPVRHAQATMPQQSQSPYKIVRAPGHPATQTAQHVQTRPAQSASPGPHSNPPTRQASSSLGQSVLRRASVERPTAEPAMLKAEQRRALPIVRSQSPEESDLEAIPVNPLR